MSTSNRTALFGFFAVWPLVMIILLLVFFFGLNVAPTANLVGIWVAMTVIFVLGWLLYIWNVFNNDRLPKEKRTLWLALLFFAGPYAMPVYFWHYLRR